MKRVSRRVFLKIGGAAAAASAVWPAWVFPDDEELPEFIKAAPVPLEEYPYREWEKIYRDQLKFDRSFPAHIGYGRYTAYVRDEKVVGLEPWLGDRGQYGGIAGGAKAYSSLRRLYGLARIKQPMLRKGFLEGKGERGSGEWAPISWEQAYESIAKRLLGAAEKYGPGSIKVVTASLARGPVSKQGALLRFANMIGAGVWLDRDAADAADAPEGAGAYYFEDPKAPGSVKKSIRFENPADFIAGREARKTKIRWHARHDFLTRCGSLSEVLKKRDPDVEMIVAQASEFDLTCEYADIVLPVHTWAEASLPDLALIGPALAVDIARGGIKPLHDGRMDIEIAAAVARKMSQLSKNPIYANYWKPAPEEFIQRVLDSGRATKGFKIGDFKNGPVALSAPGDAPERDAPRREGKRGESFRNLVKTIRPPGSRPANALYLVVRERGHSFGPEWGLSDFSQVLAGNFGDPWRTDERSPGLGEAELEVSPADARTRGIKDGDYVWVDPASSAAPDASLRTMVRCKYNPALPAGVALVSEGWRPATPETKKAQRGGKSRAATPRGYEANYRSGGIQYLAALRSKVEEEGNGIGYASLSAKEAMVLLAKAEDGKFPPAASGFGPSNVGATMKKYLSGELSRET